ncbi:Concanavalin A-like lectin protein kinase family protein [Rhynchospora pubera]|uniref:Concanavalin A-like lectin protein kinase family protein n=1 Tax=Rhynchospora pubera TaxID=906938 RepID=A0AAV8HG33_9POAL|nr:Concanavalin A-like lectin protein kinase family protein [Rhynchospora pubera]
MAMPHLSSLLHFILLLLLSLVPHSFSISFSYPSFNQASQGIQYQGQAGFFNNSIHLTSAQQDSVGRAVYYQSVPIWDSLTSNVTDFTTSFSFIVDESDDSDGLAFFLAPYPSVAPAKSDGTYLALFNGSADTIQPSQIMAVEFDSFGVSPQSNSHIKQDTEINNFSVTTVSLNASVSQGITAFAVVNYNYSTRNFTVSLSFPAGTVGRQNWSVSHTCDLKETLPSEVAVGFSSSMNNASQPHRILSWNFTSTLEKSQATVEGKNSSKLGIGLGAGFAVALFVLGLLGFVICWRRRVHKMERLEQHSTALDLSIDQAFGQGAGPRRFTYTQLLHATRNFSEDRKLGSGGSGEVYRGNLTDPNIQVAVKRISSSERGKKEYISEVTIISRIRHRNLVQLIGFCHEKGDLLLVYEFMSNGSLDTHLYNNDHVLAWPERYKIVIGVASALLYLHEECEQCVVHRDLKPSNVMLDSDFNPKLGDFGLARLMDHDNESLTTRLAGTFGYIAPEYGASGKASKETDIFSFGVVTLEILCGRKPIKRNQEEEDADLVQWVWDNYGRRAALTVVDERLQMDFEPSRVERMIAVGLWCAHPDSTQRPTIRQVINAINFDGPVLELPPQMPVAMYRQPYISSESSSSQNPYSADIYSFSSVTNSAVLGR